MRRYLDKLAEIYIEFCKGHNIDSLLLPLIGSILINISYYPYIKNQKRFKKLKTYQKVILLQSFGVTIILLISFLLGLGK